MAAILDLPEVRTRIQRWTVLEYKRLTELGGVPRRAMRTYRRSETLPCASVEDGIVAVEAWFA